MTKPPFKHDLTLKFDNEAKAIQALGQFQYEDEDGGVGWMQGDHDFALVFCGKLYEDDAAYNEEGEVVTPATPIEGYHINLQTDDDNLSEALESFKVFPANRKLDWFVRFPEVEDA